MNIDKAIRVLGSTLATEKQREAACVLIEAFERYRNRNEFAMAFLTDQKGEHCTQAYLNALRGLLQ